MKMSFLVRNYVKSITIGLLINSLKKSKKMKSLAVFEYLSLLTGKDINIEPQ